MVICKTFAMLAASALWMPESRPSATYSVDNADGSIRCHYKSETQLSKCESAMEIFVEVWAIQVDQWGWPAPIQDGAAGGSSAYDIYISTDADGGAYVMSNYVDADGTDGKLAGSSYMVLDPAIPAADLDLFIAHEFNHMLQFATDMGEPTLPVWEAASTWAEEYTYPGRGSSADSAPDFQRVPWMSILEDSDLLWNTYDTWSLYEYGAVVWLDHLREEYGADSLDLWQALISDDWDNEPDVLDAYDQLTGGWQAALLDLAIERGRIGTDLVAPWAQDYYPRAKVRVDGELSAESPELTPEVLPYDLGMSFVDVVIDTPMNLIIEADPEVEWGVVLVEEGVVVESPVLLSGSARVGVVNLGPAGFDADRRTKQRSLTYRLEAPEAPDTDPPEDSDDSSGDGGGDSDDKGCGCASSSSGAGMALSLLALGLLRRQAPRSIRKTSSSTML